MLAILILVTKMQVIDSLYASHKDSQAMISNTVIAYNAYKQNSTIIDVSLFNEKPSHYSIQ